MAITISASNQVLLNDPAVKIRTLVTIDGSDSKRYYLAQEPTSWSGINYQARVLDPGEIQGSIGDSPLSVPTVKNISPSFANADGWFSQKDSNGYYWRLGRMQIQEVCLDSASGDAIRTQNFTMTQAAMTSPTEFRLSGEDPMAPYRRRMVPSNDVLITRSMYPNLPAGSDALGRPIPIAFGRTLCPLYIVDDSNDNYDLYVACVGSAMVPDSGAVFHCWNGAFSLVDAKNNGTTLTWSYQYAVRYPGIPVTEVVVAKDIGWDDGNGNWGKRYADLVVGSWDYTPDRVLVDLLTGQFGGVCADGATLIDSDSLLSANSWYRTNSIFFDGALIEQRPLEQYLGDWQHDSMTRLVLRDKLVLSHQGSIASVQSFCAANMVDGSLRYESINIQQEESRRTLYYRDRTREAFPQDVSDFVGQMPQSFVRWDQGSGAEVDNTATFIGRRSVAHIVNQFWSKCAALGNMRFSFDATVKTANVEEGDIVTLVSSMFGSLSGTNIKPCRTLSVRRRGGTYTYELASAPVLIWIVNSHPGADNTFGYTSFQRFTYNQGCYYLTTASQVVVTSISYALGFTGGPYQPARVVRTTQWGSNLLTTSLVTANNSTAAVAIAYNSAVYPYFSGAVAVNLIIRQWHVYV